MRSNTLTRVSNNPGAVHHWPIMEILTAFVRENAPRKEGDKPEEKPSPPKPDIQTILTVLVRRERAHEKGQGRSLDLRNTDLGMADLKWALLQGAYLQGAYLQGADLQGVDLSQVLGLTKEQIESADIDDKTKLPDGLRPSE